MSTKDKLVKSAQHLLITKGFHKMNVSDIVDDAGFGKGTFYTYFDSKLDLVSYFASVILDEMVNELNEIPYNKDKSKTIKNILEVIFNYNKKNKDIIESLYHSFIGSGNLNEWESIYSKFYDRVEELLFSKKDSSTNLKAQIIVGTIERAAEQSYIFIKENSVDVEKRKKLVREMLTDIIRCA